MFYNQLEIVPIVAETKSFSKAAKLLHLSQPAVSSKIQAMEDFYGVKLFNRSSQGVTLTEAGKIVNAYAVRFGALHRAMDDELNKLLNKDNPSLIIGSSCTTGNYAMPCTIRAFKDRYPDTNIQLDISNTTNIIQKLFQKEVDVAVVEGNIDNPDLIVEHLDTVKLILVCTPGDNCIKRNSISIKDLRTKPFVMREPGAAIRKIFSEAISKYGYSLDEFNTVSQMNSIHSVKSAVLGGLGVSLVPEISVRTEIQYNLLRQIEIKELDLTLPINLVYLKNEDPTIIGQRFIRFVRQPDKREFCWDKDIAHNEEYAHA